jgi:hypothetical protein
MSTSARRHCDRPTDRPTDAGEAGEAEVDAFEP